MVRAGRRAACLAFVWLLAQPPAVRAASAEAPAPLSPAAAADSATAVSAPAQALPALPQRPEIPALEPNVPWQDVSAVTLVSMPFTAFWTLLGALTVAGISQGHFPPEIDTPMLAGAAAVAGSASLAIGLFSVQWGGSKPTALAPSASAPPSEAHP